MLLPTHVVGSTLLLLMLLQLSAAQQPTCGYQACPKTKPDVLNVHLVPHTHDDVGWLKTVDQYFYGTNPEIQRADVKTIIDSVVEQLLRDPSRRFIYVETAYLWQWWSQSNEEMRAQLRGLVLSGQLEIIGGGWSMNDEAVTHYQSTIDQFTWGFRKLNDTFGACGRPHIGWQIDPFGHSRETASLMAHMGFDGLFLGRIDYQDKEKRFREKTTEFVWQASQNLGESSQLFTNVLYNTYYPPDGFCFDTLCYDMAIVDDKTDIENYNVDKRVSAFIEAVSLQAKSYRSPHVLVTMGNDFNYMDAGKWFTNMDKIIKYTNEHEDNKVNVFYSTPSCYLKAVHEANLTWTTKQDDFFPYASDERAYWTGFYTSRPTLKYFERRGNNLLQVAKQLHVLAGLPEEESQLDTLRQTMGILQHHDAITGTEKQNVANDYALRLGQAFVDGHETVQTALNKLMAKSESSPAVVMTPCLLLNVSQCDASEHSDTFVVSVYNPLARSGSHFVRLPVPESNYKVLDPQGVEVTVQLVPIPTSVFNIPGRKSDATHELVFKAANLPALGFKTYYVEKLAGTAVVSSEVTSEESLSIGNKLLTATLDKKTNLLAKMSVAGVETKLKQSISYYEPFERSNLEPYSRVSGAYVFRPKDNNSLPIGSTTNIKSYKGPLVEEVHQVFSDWVSQVIRVYEGENHVEIEWQVGPIPTDDRVGREVISRFSTDWSTNGVFNTDSNGRETLQRKRNFRPNWTANISEPVSGNYYPITTAIGIKSGGSALAVLPDRAQGGSSIHDGEVELMLHRRLSEDDGYGVDEPLNETAFGKGLVARGRHILVLGSDSSSPTVAAQTRQLAQSRMVLAPWLLLAPTQLTPQQWQQNYHTEYSGLTAALPDNVHLLTLEPWKDDSLLLRLEHFLEHSDDPLLSSPATLTLEDLFSAFTVVSATETTLGGNQLLEESDRLAWQVMSSGTAERGSRRRAGQTPSDSSNKFCVTLEPMQIRTFLVKVAPRANGLKETSAGAMAQIYEYFNSLSYNMFH